MRNVTVTLEDEVADWSRVWAAQHQTSVSRMLGELLAEKMAADERYASALENYLAAPAVRLLDVSGERSYPSRDETHDR